MSQFIRKDDMSKSMHDKGATRNYLLASVSSMVLVISVCGGPALADEKPALWLELDGSIGNVRMSTADVDTPLGTMVQGLSDPLTENLKFDRVYTNDGKITFRPDDSDWVFSASVRYGRSHGASKIGQALAPIPTTSFVSYAITYPYFPSSNKSDTKSVPVRQEKIGGNLTDTESHLVIDFEAGKDVGLGLFGHGSTSVVSAGVRFAHFNISRHADNFHETNGIHFASSHFATYVWPGFGTNRRELWDEISASGSVVASFNGVGPSIQWEASAPLWGGEQAHLSLDWGVTAAILFGKQQRKTHHQSSSTTHCTGHNCPATPAVLTGEGSERFSKSITVPNVGGFAGVSLNTQKLKVSIGYRADFFENAIDVGVAARKSSNLLFHGPYASISIGLGD